MVHIRSVFQTLLVAGALLLTSFTFTNPKDEQAIAQAVERLRKAMIDPDKATLEAITARELSYGHSNGLIENQDAFVKALLNGSSDFVTIELSDQTMTIVDKTAWVRHKLTAETKNNGTPGQTKLGVLLVFVKQKNDWKLLARQAVKI
ncbi:nuclear transport factor 2 family protein [Nibrella viscosa]|uniref:Nuclear transport factor 2 family protein n=1 Tax=Nibrella viscosa TaxID=1084524 RepID=A0ABP8KV85_9BACT